MTSDQQLYAELLSLTQQYLLQEHNREEWVASNPETVAVFKAFMQTQKKAPAAITTPPVPHIQQATVPKAAPLQPKPLAAPTLIAKPPVVKPIGRPPLPMATKKVEPQPAEKKQAPIANHGFNLEFQSNPPPADFTDIKKVLKERYPSMTFLDEIPSDEEAKRISNSWQQKKIMPAVIVLSFQESPKEHELLQSMAAAIQNRLAPAAVMTVQQVENDFGWDNALQSKELRLIIANTHGLNAHPELMQHYREMQKQAKFFLARVPLCLLSDLSLYLKDPKLKQAVWRDITEKLTASG